MGLGNAATFALIILGNPSSGSVLCSALIHSEHSRAQPCTLKSAGPGECHVSSTGVGRTGQRKPG